MSGRSATRCVALPAAAPGSPSVACAAFGRLLVAAAVAVALARPGARAADNVAVGLEGAWRSGGWTPVVIESADAAAGDAVVVWADDPDGQAVGSPPAPYTRVEAGGRARVRVRIGRPSGSLRVERVRPSAAGSGSGGSAGGASAAGEIVPLGRPLDPLEKLIVVVGDLPAVARAARLVVREGLPRARIVSVADPRSLGVDALDYSAADAIIVCGRAVIAAGTPAAAALRGIDEWVRQGGRLVLVAGASAADPAFSASPAADWLPGPPGTRGTVERLVPLRRATALETYARAGRPLDRGAIDGLQAPLLADARRLEGLIEAFEGTAPGDLPLVVRSPRGFGTVTWVGIDVDQGAFRSWAGTETLVVELLGGRPPAENAGRSGEAAAQGQDLTGQLRAAVDQFPGVKAVPFEIVAALALSFILFLYPIDWVIVSGGQGRHRLAWLTLPLAVAAFTGAAWWTARHWKGREWRASRADMVDIDQAPAAGVAGPGIARGVSFAGIWSPANDRLAVAARPAAGVPAGSARMAVSWLAASGRGMGSTDAAASHPGLATGDYMSSAGLGGLEGVPIAADSSRLFETQWTASATAPAVAATLRRGAQGTLTGTIENRLPWPLEGCILLHAGWLWDVGDLDPGGRFDAGVGRGPRSLAAGLTRRTTVKDREVNERWDIGGVDALRILEIAGFHDAVGGSGYTALEAGRLARLDLSPLLEVGRAVLVGRGPPGTDWTAAATNAGAVPSADRGQRGLWRIVIPVGGGAP